MQKNQKNTLSQNKYVDFFTKILYAIYEVIKRAGMDT